MKTLIALALLSLPLAASAATNQIDYDLKVDGMVCAFCAYNASRQIETLDGVAFLTVTMMADELEAGEFDTMLEELGAIAAQRSGRITVVAPEEFEIAILGPVLGGRKTVLKVDYESAIESDSPIIVSVARP